MGTSWNGTARRSVPLARGESWADNARQISPGEVAMLARPISRRGFACTLGAAVGAALVAPKLVTPLAEARLPSGVPEDIIQLNSNENPYGPSPKALAAIRKTQRIAARYPDALDAMVAQAIAKQHGVEPANVLLGCGSTEILRVSDMAFLGPGKNVVVAEPTFEAVLDYNRVTRAEPIKVPLTPDFRHDLERMAAACNDRTGLAYVCNPNNPTATIATRDELGRFFAQVPKSTTILVDEAYYHFVEAPGYTSALEWVGKLPNLIVARTFSKVYGLAGMRLGYGVSTKENIRAMRAHLTQSNTNAAVLAAALASLAEPDYVLRRRALINDTRRWLCRELDKEGRRYIPSQANFVMIDVGGDVQPLIERFAERKILVGRKFPSLGNWLRVSIGTHREMEAFLAALRAIVPVATRQAA